MTRLQPVGGSTFNAATARRKRIDDLSMRPKADPRPLPDSPPEAWAAEEWIAAARTRTPGTRLEMLRTLLEKFGPVRRQPIPQRPEGRP